MQLSAQLAELLALAARLVVVLAIFVPLERLFAHRRQNLLRAGFVTDLAYYFFANLLPKLALVVPISVLAWGLHRAMPSAYYAWVAALPEWLWLGLAVLAGEVGFYWGHRVMHAVPMLWRFHAIHHAAEDMDFLVNTRAHPVDLFLSRLAALLPIYLLGLAQPTGDGVDLVPVLVALIGSFWGFFVHANIAWRFGWLEWAVATPGFHHWHHANDGPATIDKNFASMLPGLDWLFGTFYLPKGAFPSAYGIDAPLPAGFWNQMFFPFTHGETTPEQHTLAAILPSGLSAAPAASGPAETRHPSAIRDAGLLRRIGPLAFAAAIINGVVGAGIFSLPAAMSHAAGDAAPLAYLLCAVAMGMVVTCLAEAGSRLPTSGGVYGYVADAFGPFAGFLCGMMTWMASVLACGGIASAFAGTIGSVVPFAAGGLGRALVILAAIGGITLVNLCGVRGGAGLVSISTAIKLVPLLLFVSLALFAGPLVVTGAPALPAHDFARAVILGMFAFSGMETVLGASGEVADANQTVPRAMFGAMGFVLLLYVAIQLVAQRLLGPALAQQAAPLAAAAAKVSHAAGGILVAGAALSMLGWIGSDILGAPRVLFAFARDGLLPAVLGRVHPGSRVPHVAILFHACLAASLAISGSFVSLAVAATLNTAGLYFLGCGAAWVLHRRGTQMAGVPLTLRFLPVASVLGMVSMVLLIGVAARDEILGFVAVICVSSALYLAMRWLRTP